MWVYPYGYSWIRQRDFVSDNGLTAASSLCHVCLTRHACAIFEAERDSVEQSSLFLEVGRGNCGLTMKRFMAEILFHPKLAGSIGNPEIRVTLGLTKTY